MSIKQITVYNVGFGDCLKMQLDNNKHILLDCGGNIVNSKKEKIKNDILDSQKSGVNLIISHFHSDHYNILQLFEAETVDVLYIPNFFSQNEIKLLLYLLLVQSSKSNIYLFALELLMLIPNVVFSKKAKKSIIKKNGCIIFVKKGDTILDEFNVLWPMVNNDNVNKILNVIQNQFINNQYINDRITDLTKYYEEQINVIQNREIPTISDANINVFEYAAIKIQEIVNEELKLREELDNKINFNNETKTLIRNIQNSVSLVFQSRDNTKNVYF